MGLDAKPENGNGRTEETKGQGRGVLGFDGISVRKFDLGQMVQTANSLAQLHPEDVLIALRRHSLGDWGDCGAEDWAENDVSLKEGGRLLSVYQDRLGTKFWVITESTRHYTTVLLPEDY